MKSNAHKTEDGLDKIKAIKARMNTKRKKVFLKYPIPSLTVKSYNLFYMKRCFRCLIKTIKLKQV